MYENVPPPFECNDNDESIHTEARWKETSTGGTVFQMASLFKLLKQLHSLSFEKRDQRKPTRIRSKKGNNDRMETDHYGGG